MARKVAHFTESKMQWKETQNGVDFIMVQYRYLCGRVVDAFIEKSEYQEPARGWPPGTTLCKKCERKMSPVLLESVKANVSANQNKS